jgi:hypothetical protein
MIAAFPLFLHYFSATQKFGSPKNYQQLVRRSITDMMRKAGAQETMVYG